MRRRNALEPRFGKTTELESYRPKLKDIEQQLAEPETAAGNRARIVPDEKEVDGFMKMMDAEAQKAGIELRRLHGQAD
jgi:hypothetical protein